MDSAMELAISLAVLCFIVAAASTSSPPVHSGVGGLYKDPNLEIIIKGSDVSTITAAAEDGAIHTNLGQKLEIVPGVVPLPVTPVAPVVEQTIKVNASIVKPAHNSDLVYSLAVPGIVTATTSPLSKLKEYSGIDGNVKISEAQTTRHFSGLSTKTDYAFVMSSSIPEIGSVSVNIPPQFTSPFVNPQLIPNAVVPIKPQLTLYDSTGNPLRLVNASTEPQLFGDSQQIVSGSAGIRLNINGHLVASSPPATATGSVFYFQPVVGSNHIKPSIKTLDIFLNLLPIRSTTISLPPVISATTRGIVEVNKDNGLFIANQMSNICVKLGSNRDSVAVATPSIQRVDAGSSIKTDSNWETLKPVQRFDIRDHPEAIEGNEHSLIQQIVGATSRNVHLGDGGQVENYAQTLWNIHQQKVPNDESPRAGIDASQIPLINIPSSVVLPVDLTNFVHFRVPSVNMKL